MEHDTRRVDTLLSRPENIDLRSSLFVCGFLITTADVAPGDDFPFYGNWKSRDAGGFRFLTHARTGVHFYEDAGRTWFLLGHAYDPFSMKWREEEILADAADAAGKGAESLRTLLDGLTGIYVVGYAEDGRLYIETDASGIQSCAAGLIDGALWVTSHPQLVGDLCGLDMDPFVRELLDYKWYYRVMGPYLPADLTPFTSLRRVMPDAGYVCTRDSITHSRFWPLRPNPTAADEAAYDAVIGEAADLLHRNMELVTEKWEKPAISLTGGIDSGTTFAAANGLYDRVTAFSYRSAEKEDADNKAAALLAGRFGVPHTLYRIPDDDDAVPRLDAVRAVIDHNNGYATRVPDHELRQRAFLLDLSRTQPFGDVEVKSWVSETVRAYWYKHYGRGKLPPLSPKLYRNIWKIFILNRRLAHRADAIYADYLREYEYDAVSPDYLPGDLYTAEMMWGGWGSVNISEMKIYSDITIIYNNRRLLDLLLRAPLRDRISDAHHLALRKKLNPEQYDMNLRVVNKAETPLRAFLLNVVFTINMKLPF